MSLCTGDRLLSARQDRLTKASCSRDVFVIVDEGSGEILTPRFVFELGRKSLGFTRALRYGRATDAPKLLVHVVQPGGGERRPRWK